MSSKKIINGNECEKVEIVSVNINGEDLSENLFTGEYISNLSKDGPVIINIETIDHVNESISTSSVNDNINNMSKVNTMASSIIDDNVDSITNNNNNSNSSNKNIFIGIGIGITITVAMLSLSLILF